MQNIFSFVAEHTAAGQKVALVTVTKTAGSSPASVGQVIAVLADGTTSGTVGGGASEYRVIQQAIEVLQAGEPFFTFAFDHAENGMVCGGSMEGFGNVLGSQARLVIFGGGHVAQSLAPLALATGFSVTVVEDRPEFAKDFTGVEYIVAKPSELADTLTVTNTMYAVICTRGHKTDDAALQYCVGQPFAYIGMIGSTKKVKSVFENLKNTGISADILEKVYAPVGLDIASTIPAEIAISVLAEILLVKNKGKLRHKRD